MRNAVWICLFLYFNTLFAQNSLLDYHYPDSISVRINKKNIVIEYLIDFYQKNISVKSIERCPFKTSCSNFARHVFERYGIIKGMMLFIDRYYFREHKYSYRYYIKIIKDDKILLDDDLFLEDN